MSDNRHPKACVQRAELILEWLVKLQYQPIGTPILQRDLTDNCAGARQVSCERLVVRVANQKITADEMRSDYEPYFVAGTSVESIGENAYRIEQGMFTTHDSPDPSFHLRARTIRVYEKDHVVFQNVTFYVGQVPVFWWPYAYQSLDDAFSFQTRELRGRNRQPRLINLGVMFP